MHNITGAKVEVRQGHPLGCEHGVKVKGYNIIELAERSSTASRVGGSLHQGWSQKRRVAEEEYRRYRGVRCA